MKSIEQIRLSNYLYELPQERIAKFPLDNRDEAKLQVYEEGHISHREFHELSSVLPSNAMLVFNDTKVIHARLYFRRQTGALIETLLLSPIDPYDVQQSMKMEANCTWKCTIGRKKRWKAGEILQQKIEIDSQTVTLSAELVNRDENHVHFSWNESIPFAKIVEQSGELPLPPYLGRKATEKDERQYQTVYAEKAGAVAAPTAGLHFTNRVLQTLADKGIKQEYVTLHVGAGTFLPVKHDLVVEHDMHAEQVVINRDQLLRIAQHQGPIVAVGTTSVRVLESTYWLGVQLISASDVSDLRHPFLVEKLEPYNDSLQSLPNPKEAIMAIIEAMDKQGLSQWMGQTEIFIMPGYEFKLCKGLITNYHMPETTLILLIAAFIGDDWRKVYQSALDESYRFLSYGDSSLLLPKKIM